MSKGNMLLGYAAGKVGNLVFARLGGKQITKAHNPTIKNPRTASQMTVRSKFLSANKFFTRGNQNFFRFAFQDQKQDESDMNAFMRNNRSNAFLMSQQAFQESTYPSIAPWTMTKGNLCSPVQLEFVDQIGWMLDPNDYGQEATVGLLSRILRDKYGVQNGDIVTLTLIRATGITSSSHPTPYPSTEGAVLWEISQFIADTDSDDTPDLKGGLQLGADESGVFFFHEQDLTDAEGFCITISRNTRKRLEVNTTILSLNDIARTFYEEQQQGNYINSVLESWEATPATILEGGIVDPQVTPTPKAEIFLGLKGAAATLSDLDEIEQTAVGQPLKNGIGNGKYFVKILMKEGATLDLGKLTFDEINIMNVIWNAQTSVLTINSQWAEAKQGALFYYDGKVLFGVAHT